MLRILKGQTQMLFLVLTNADEVCGGFLDQPIQYNSGKYCGTGECFLFSWNCPSSADENRDTYIEEDMDEIPDSPKLGKFKVFTATGLNQYYFYCDDTGLSFGSE